MGHFQQAEFQMEALLLPVAEFAVGAQHDLQMAGQVFFAEQVGDAADAGPLVAGNLQQVRIFAGDFRDQGVAQEADQLAAKCAGFWPSLISSSARRRTFSLEPWATACITSSSTAGGGRSDELADGLGGEAVGGGGDGLVENGERVAHRAVARFGKQGERVFVGFELLAPRSGRELAQDVFEADGAKTEVLAARADGLRDVFGLRGGQHEDHVAGRFLERLEQRIEGGVGDLVGFVEDVDLEAVARGTVAGGFAQFANLVDAAVGGGVDFDYIDRVAGANFGAGIADAAGLGHRLVRGAAVERHGQDAGDGGFADAAMAAEDVAVRNALLLDGVLQRAGDVLLANDFGEFLRTVFAGQDLVAHGLEEIRLYVIGVRLYRAGCGGKRGEQKAFKRKGRKVKAHRSRRKQGGAECYG